jgi:hypothetical protein
MKALSVLRIHRCSSVPADCTIRHHSWDSGGCSSESDGYNFRRRSLVADGYSSASRGCSSGLRECSSERGGYSSASRGCSSDLGECSSEPDGYSCCRSADCTSHWNRSSVADGCTNRSHIRGCSPGTMARAAAPRSDCFPQSGNSTGCSRTSSRSGRLLPQAVALTARRSHHVDYFQLPVEKRWIADHFAFRMDLRCCSLRDQNHQRMAGAEQSVTTRHRHSATSDRAQQFACYCWPLATQNRDLAYPSDAARQHCCPSVSARPRCSSIQPDVAHSPAHLAVGLSHSMRDAIQFRSRHLRLHYHVQPPQSVAAGLRHSKPDESRYRNRYSRWQRHVQPWPSKHG